MADTLVRTKLYIPRARSRLVPRLRLTVRLAAGMSRKLTLVSAPAGSGKTTLIAEFAREIDRPVAWVSLDSGDNDAARFLAYLITAVSSARPGIGESLKAMLESPQPPPVERAITMLINDVAAAQTELAVVLDDYHAINNDAVHNAMSFLLEHQPSNLHLVIASRTSPPLPLARLRARDELTELRTPDLRFTEQEASAFLNEVMLLGLSPETVAALETRTEGWIAGLQLAALSIEKRATSGEFIKEFTGRHSYVLDYLVDEVIKQQPEAVQSFLLQTSILERMTGSLCNAVTGQTGGQSMLRSLEEANLFVVPLDDERRWHRYHHLFGEFLLNRLREESGDHGLRSLHYRAALWFEQNGFTAEAIDHAISACEFELAAGMIEQAADELYSRGSIATLQRWLERLPDEVLRARPRAAIYYAWVLFFAGEGREEGTAFQRAEDYLEAAEQALTAASGDAASRDAIGIAYAVRTAMASAAPVRKSPLCAQRDLARTIQCGQQALAHLARNNLIWRCVVNIGLGFAYRVVGDVAAATRAFAEAGRQGHEGGNLSGALFAYSNCASLLIAQGRLHEAEKTYREALRVAAAERGDSLPITGQIYVGLGRLLYERNELAESAHNLTEGLKRGEAMGYTAPDVLMSLARVRHAQGMSADAQALEARASKLIDEPGLHSHFVSQAQLERVRLMLSKDNVTSAAGWAAAAGINASDELNPWREPEYVTLARVLAAQGKAKDALLMLDSLSKRAESSGRHGNLVELLIVKAAALAESGGADEARACLERALALAEPPGYVRSFVDEGNAVASALGQIYQGMKRTQKSNSGASRDYVERVLLAFRRAEQQAGAEIVRPPPGELVEPFSERELEVIRLLAAGRSNQQIADELFVALSTVKWHVNNIYGKLNVKSRTQAISRAQQLGLV